MLQIQNPFKRPSVAQVNAEMLVSAQFELSQHKASLEFHQAMVSMYEGRIKRLQSESGFVA